MAKNFYWIKLEHRMLDEADMAILPDRLWRRYVECLLLAGKYDKDGELPDTTSIAWALHISLEDADLDLKQLANYGKIQQTATGWYLPTFSYIQAPKTNAERVSDYRERKRNEARDEDVTDALRSVTHIKLNKNRLDNNIKLDDITAGDNGEIFKLFNDNIQLLVPLTAEALVDDIKEYGGDWVKDAITVAVENNARNLAYIEAVLKNRKAGKSFGKNGKGKAKVTIDRTTEEARNRYGEWEQ